MRFFKIKLFFIFITSIILFFWSLNFLFFNTIYVENDVILQNQNNFNVLNNEEYYDEHNDIINEYQTTFELPIEIENKVSINEQVFKNLELGFILYFILNGNDYNGNLPNEISKNQIRYRYELANDIEFLVFNQSNFNLDIKEQKLEEAGIFVRRSLNEGWKYFLKINNTQQKNNIYDFWSDNKFDLFVLVVDDNGAGSGEGVAKVFKSNNGGKNWQIEKCFYYIPEFQDNVNNSKSNLTEVVNNYIKQNPKYIYKNNDSKCNVNLE